MERILGGTPRAFCNMFSRTAPMSFGAPEGLDVVPADQPGKGSLMRVVVSDFISLDGVVQAPGGQGEDTDGGFRHGGWSMPYFDPDSMGPAVEQIMAETEALLFGRRTWQTMAAAWPDRAGDPFADRMNAIP